MKKTLSMLAVLGVMCLGIQSANAFCWSNLNPANWGHCPCQKVKKCDPCDNITGGAANCDPCAKKTRPCPCKKKAKCDPCQKQTVQPCNPCEKKQPCDPCDKLQEMNR